MVEVYWKPGEYRIALQYSGSPGSGGDKSAGIFYRVVYYLSSFGFDIVQYDFLRYIPGIDAIRPTFRIPWNPFVALIIAVLCAMYFLGKKQGYNGEQLKKILDRSLRPTIGQILLVITGRRVSGYYRIAVWEILSDLHWKKLDFRLYL